ncbi:MAG TPA: AraC family transcriptional regulator [Streptosporangiaceae bacterium]|nr:AraC family transcriptional regulator [Streptosporangiaceae bacterium]
MSAAHRAVARAPAGQPVREHVTALPAPGLRPLIAHYSGYRDAGQPPGRHRGLPSPYLTVIFTLDEPLEVARHPDPGQAGGQFGTLAGGLHTAPALITHDGRQSGIQVALSPLGARTILGLPAGELASLDVEGSAVLGSLAEQVQDKIRAARSWAERFAAVDELLWARACASPAMTRGGAADLARGRGPGVSPEVGCAWRRLMRTGGQTTVAQLAAETGWSDRHLRSRFQAETGLSPKAAARVIRFERARRLLMRRAQAGTRPALAELAAECGYYDQAHLDREFRGLAGCPPTTWLAEEYSGSQPVSPRPLPEPG